MNINIDIIHNSPNSKQPKYLSVDEWINKMGSIHYQNKTCTGRS